MKVRIGMKCYKRKLVNIKMVISLLDGLSCLYVTVKTDFFFHHFFVCTVNGF